jgi:hypothetical protein
MRVRHPVDAATCDTEAGRMAPVTGEGRGHLSGKHQSSHRICRSGPSLSATAFPPLPRSPRREVPLQSASAQQNSTVGHISSTRGKTLLCCVNKLVIPIGQSAKFRNANISRASLFNLFLQIKRTRGCLPISRETGCLMTLFRRLCNLIVWQEYSEKFHFECLSLYRIRCTKLNTHTCPGVIIKHTMNQCEKVFSHPLAF